MTSTSSLLQGRRILLLDDEKYTLRMLRTVLQGLGATDVIDASNAEEAARLLEGGRYGINCLCADFNMPRVHGLLLVKAIRLGARGLPRDLPIIMLTGHTSTAIVEAARALHVNGLIRKPVSRAQLETALYRIFSTTFQAAPPEVYRAVNVKFSLGGEETLEQAALQMAASMQVDLDVREVLPGVAEPPPPLVERILPAHEVDIGNIVARPSEIIEGVTFATGLNINNRHVALIQHLMTTGPVGDVYVRIPELLPRRSQS